MKISGLEALVLVATVLFAIGTGLWFLQSTPEPSLTMVQTEHPPEPVQAREVPEAPGLLPGEVMDLNTVSAADLTRLPGIGEKKAADLIAWRESHGGFPSVEAITEVKGIGAKTLERLRPYLTVGPAAAEKGGQYGTDLGGR